VGGCDDISSLTQVSDNNIFILIQLFKYDAPIVPIWDFAVPSESIQAKSSNRQESTERSKSFETQRKFLLRHVAEEVKLRSHDL
jgi:hypothetical protein